MSAILVTGAAGAFGGNYAKRMLDDGHEVISIRHDEAPVDTASLLGIRDKITWVRGSILDANLCKRVVADYGVDEIVHFAALPIVSVATRTAVPIFECNILGTIHLLEAVKDNYFAGKEIKFVMVSTDKSYGDAGKKPYTENMPLCGLGVYDASKSCADLIARSYHSCGYAPYLVVVRPCNLVSKGDMNLGRVLPRTILPALRGESPILYKTSYLREFIDVDNAVESIYLLSKNMHKDNINGEAFNVGSGQQRGLEQMVSAVLKHFPCVTPTWTEAPPISKVEIPFQALNSEKINRAIGWKASKTPEQAVDDLVTWWREIWPTLPKALREKRITGWHG